MVEDYLDEKTPIQVDSGEFACPDCKIQLQNALVPCYSKGKFLGAFDGLRCPMCLFGLLSEKGYWDSEKEAQRRDHIKEMIQVNKKGD